MEFIGDLVAVGQGVAAEGFLASGAVELLADPDDFDEAQDGLAFFLCLGEGGGCAGSLAVDGDPAGFGLASSAISIEVVAGH